MLLTEKQFKFSVRLLRSPQVLPLHALHADLPGEYRNLIRNSNPCFPAFPDHQGPFVAGELRARDSTVQGTVHPG